MEDIMFKLFERQSNWTLRQLIQETDQPEVCILIAWFLHDIFNTCSGCLFLVLLKIIIAKSKWTVCHIDLCKLFKINIISLKSFEDFLLTCSLCSNFWKICLRTSVSTITREVIKDLMSWSQNTRKQLMVQLPNMSLYLANSSGLAWYWFKLFLTISKLLFLCLPFEQNQMYILQCKREDWEGNDEYFYFHCFSSHF